MSVRKPQSPQVKESLQVLQFLIQLSTSPLLRTVLTTLTHHQLVILGGLFVVTLIFALGDNASWIRVRNEVAIEFFSAVSQSLAALLGLLVVFLTFRIQAITEERLNHYRVLQSQLDQLIRLIQDLPSELQSFDDTLIEILDYFVPLQMKDFPILPSQYDRFSWDRTIINFRNEWTSIHQKLPRTARLYLQQILVVLNNIDEVIVVLSSLYSGTLRTSHTIIAIAKLSFLLGASLVFLLLFGIVGLQKVFPDLSLPVIVTLAGWVLIALLELVIDAWRLYKELRNS